MGVLIGVDRRSLLAVTVSCLVLWIGWDIGSRWFAFAVESLF